MSHVDSGDEPAILENDDDSPESNIPKKVKKEYKKPENTYNDKYFDGDDW